MSPNEPRNSTPDITLKACAYELRCRCEAIARLQGSHTYYHEELEVFRTYAHEQKLFLKSKPPELSRPPDDEGNEHQVWFNSVSSTDLKATWPDFFGMQVIHRNHEEAKASPVAYLERWQLHNEIFGDDVQFLGVLETEGSSISLLIKQPAITGQPATLEQIKNFFTENHWLPFQIQNNLAFFDPVRKIVISDTHRGNIILMDDGLLAPIDLRIQALTPALLDTVVKLCQSQLK
jgi:hypothetical protein